MCRLFQYGPYSDVSEITTAAGPPGQCKAPCISFTPDGCVLVSWEVSQARVLHRFLFLLLCLPPNSSYEKPTRLKLTGK